MKTPLKIILAWGVIIQCLVLAPLYAQHPIEVERYFASSEYLRAMVAFERLPSRQVRTETLVSAGQSAWALGLAEEAVRSFDKALQDTKLSKDQRAQLLLFRGIIEFQEGRYQAATLFAERAMDEVPTRHPVVGSVLLLWGDSLSHERRYGAAVEKYRLAIDFLPDEDLPEVSYRLGEGEFRLGSLDQARVHLESIPLSHERAPTALRLLAEIALMEKSFEKASFWLGKARELFPQQFLDGWIDYARMSVAVERQKTQEVRQLLEDARKRYPPSDHWLTLLEAAGEAFLWSSLQRGVLAMEGSNAK